MAVSCPSVSTYKKKCNIQRVRVRFFGIGIYVLPKPFPPCPQKKTVTPFSLVPDDLQFPQVENHTVKTINLHIKCQQFRKICDISRECDFDGVGNVCVRFFFFNLHRDYSNSLTLSTAGELSWSWNPQFRNRKKILSPFVYVLHKTWN